MIVGLSDLEKKILRIAREPQSVVNNRTIFSGPSIMRLRRRLFPDNPKDYFEDRKALMNGHSKNDWYVQKTKALIKGLREKGLIDIGYDGKCIEITEFGKLDA